MIRITSRRHNFRRCGMPHPKGPVEYPENKFSEKEIDVLRAEPMLTVETIEEKSIDVKLIAAANKAVADGKVLSDGRPDAKAMSEILGETITAKIRNKVWSFINKE